jgi:DNA polymerase-3 subunit alpha (Gram-positive type)
MKNKRYVVFDIETTGFSPTSDRITEIGAVKIENVAITEEFSQLIDPGIPVPRRITEITGITTEMVAGKPAIEEVLPLFLEFCSGCAIVAHNAKFDMGFIKFNAETLGLDCDFEIVDTLAIARRSFPELDNHRLETVANYLNIELLEHHRAADDARAAAHIFLRCSEGVGSGY